MEINSNIHKKKVILLYLFPLKKLLIFFYFLIIVYIHLLHVLFKLEVFFRYFESILILNNQNMVLYIMLLYYFYNKIFKEF